MELLQFVFQDWKHFFGTLLLLLPACWAIANFSLVAVRITHEHNHDHSHEFFRPKHDDN